MTLQVDDEILKIEREKNEDLKNIEILTGNDTRAPDRRSYGESRFVQLPSARTPWPNDRVSARAVKGRAAIVRDFISLLSGSSGRKLSKVEADQIDSFLFVQLVKQNKEMFIKILRSSNEVL